MLEANGQKPEADSKIKVGERKLGRLVELSEAMKDVISCDKPRVGANIP